MNDNTKVLDQNPVSMPVSGNQAQPLMGSFNKEVPITTELPELKLAGPEVKHTIDQELSNLKVQETVDKPDLTQVDNVTHAGPHVPVSTFPSGKVSLPMSEEEVANQLNTGQDDDSGKSLAKLIQKIIKKMMGGF